MRPKERVSHDHWQPSWLRHEHLERYRFASQFVNDRTVVDCACGDGTGTRLLAQAGAKRVHAFDRSPEALAMARKTTARTHAELELTAANSLPLPNGSVDVYVSLETIEHVDEVSGFPKARRSEFDYRLVRESLVVRQFEPRLRQRRDDRFRLIY